MKNIFYLLIIIFCQQVFSQYIVIDSVRRQDANGVPLLLGQTVTVRGIATTQRELGTSLVYFQDYTGGLVAFDVPFCTAINRGDSFQVTGVVTQYNGLTEFQPVNSWTVYTNNNPVAPVVVTAGTIRTNGEPYEGRLIRINGITQVKNTSGVPVTQWNVSGSGTNFRIFVGTDSCEIRIFSTTNIANAPIPTFPFDVVAVNSQFDSSPPYNSGYQILPRSLSDFYTAMGSGPLISAITYSAIQQNSVTINWTTSANADSKVRWMLTDSNYQPSVYTDSIYNASQVTAHSIVLSGLQPGRIYYFNVTSANGGGSTTSSLQYFCTQSTSPGTINVYFNKSVDTTLNTGEIAQGNVNFQTALLQRINSAQYSIDMCLYSFDDLTQLRDALINARIRGVIIRFVYDSRTNQSLVNDLIAAGIPIQKRNQNTSDLMHNKFFIFDFRNTTSANDDWLWAGCTNVTQQQFYTDANTVIMINDKTLCGIYTREFEEMWGSHGDLPNSTLARFGPNKTDNVPHITNVNGTKIDVYFSPSDNPSTQIENMINNGCDNSIYFSAYAFTRCTIHNRMKSKFDAGKEVKGVFDDGNGNDPVSVYRTMKGLTGGACPPVWSPAGDVWLDSRTGLLHHKYILVDAWNTSSTPTTEVGSFNFSNAATFDNDENFMLIYSNRVTNLYLQEFYQRYKDGGGTGTIGITQISNEVPERFSLSQNYPNPFNPMTNIKFQMPNAGFVKISVFDVLGKEVATLVNEKLNPGTYEAEFDGTKFASGVYFYKIIATDYTESKKMVLIK